MTSPPPKRFPFRCDLDGRPLVIHANSMRVFQDGGVHIVQAWDVIDNAGHVRQVLEQRGRTAEEASRNFWQMIDDMGEFHK